MSNFSWVIFILVISFFIFVGVRFRKTRLLSSFAYQSDEKILFEDRPVKIEQMTNAGGRGKRTRGIMWPVIKITDKHIVIGQQKESSPDGIIYIALSFLGDSESMLENWWKRGYVTMPITKSEIQGRVQEDGAYTVEIPLEVNLPMPNRQPVQQVIVITTRNFTGYEKALGMKIQIRN
ncbi:MAG: hypothetical protein KBD29_03445 [Candidatus Magasanikbacteria bacterium]|nr:hypothetical protein [Candidatus Magasanikbacteria bacterium]